MKQFMSFLLVLLLIAGMSGCENDETDLSFDMSGGSDLYGLESSAMKAKLLKATASVEFLWKGAEKGSDMGNKPEGLRAFFSFDAHEVNSVQSPNGEIVYTVTYPDLSPHREIRAAVTGVAFDGTMAWITGIVISDTKGCAGDGNGNHESGCSNGSGGCGEESDGHDGGCSDDGTEGGGCSDGGADEGGCSDGGTDEGGCSDGGTDDGGCSDSGSGEEGEGSDSGHGSPGGDMGNPLSGKNCRIGQVIAIKIHDKGTPGIYDGLSWKWFSPTGAFVPSIENNDSWGQPGNQGPVKLCKKTIVGGNIVVHN